MSRVYFIKNWRIKIYLKTLISPHNPKDWAKKNISFLKNDIEILFINTPTQVYNEKNRELEDYSTIPPFGLGYVATAATEVIPREKIEFIDGEYERLSVNELEEVARKINPKTVALNITTPNYSIAKEIIIKIGQVIGKNIIVGGAHPTLSPNEILMDDDISDYIKFVSIGQGEEVIKEYLKGSPFYNIPNISYINQSGRIENSYKSLLSKDYVDSLIIDRSFFNNDLVKEGGRIESYVLTSRGCPYKCSFCAAPLINPNFTSRRDESLEREIRELIDREVNYIRFIDDLFLVSSKRVKELKKLFARIGINKKNFGFEATARTNIIHRFNDETWKMLVEMGLKELEIGIESGSLRILNKMRKKTTNEYVYKSVKMASSYGVDVKGFIMLGYPTETYEELQQTVELCENLKIIAQERVRFSPVVVKAYPGTEMYEDVKEIIDPFGDTLIDLTKHLDEEFSFDDVIILKKRNRYNAVHTLDEEPIALSQITGGASMDEVLSALSKIVLISVESSR